VLCGKDEKETRTLLTFSPDMTVEGSGMALGQYDVGRWGKIQIDYNTFGECVEIGYILSCTAAPDKRMGHVATDVLPFETELSDLAIIVTQGTCFLDDIRMKKKP